MLTESMPQRLDAMAEAVRSFPADHGFLFGMLMGFLIMRVLTYVLRFVDSRRIATGGTPILPLLGIRPRGDFRTKAQRVEDAKFLALAHTYHRED